MNNIITSIIVPCFNQGEYLNTLIDNIAESTKKNHEVIVINDGSTCKRTISELNDLKSVAKHQVLRIIDKPNGGLSSARNLGMDESSGKYIQFLDSDDLLTADKIDSQIELIEDYDLDVHISNWVACNEDNSGFTFPDGETICEDKLDFKGVAGSWERGLSIPIHCPLFKSEVLETIRFNEKLKAKEDWFFWMELMSKKPSVAYKNFIGAVYRQHSESMTKKDLSKMGFYWLQASLEAFDSFDSFGSELLMSSLDYFKVFYLRHFFLENGPRLFENKYNDLVKKIYE